MDLALAVLAVVTGATLQRSTGLGFALVSGPFLVLVLSPYEGVALANLLSLVTCCLVLAGTWRSVDMRAVALLSAGVVLAIAPGAVLVRVLPDPALLVVVGGIATVAAVLVAAGRPIPGLARPPGAVAAGFAAGFSNVTAGIGGPALAVYRASTRQPHSRFVPTVQVVGIVMNTLSLVAKHDAQLPVPLVLTCVGAVVAGAVVGRWTARLVSERVARTAVLALAVCGGLASVAKGLLTA